MRSLEYVFHSNVTFSDRPFVKKMTIIVIRRGSLSWKSLINLIEVKKKISVVLKAVQLSRWVSSCKALVGLGLYAFTFHYSLYNNTSDTGSMIRAHLFYVHHFSIKHSYYVGIPPSTSPCSVQSTVKRLLNDHPWSVDPILSGKL